ncbi:MAG: hypothetical protein V7L01_30135 [Nostoc sp.]|uniref:hypothetical protein n=1 Tax=Nostoc sp. TaxID=1180 RepID=UPI002FF7F058
MRRINLNNQQKLLYTPLFTSPSVLFPDVFCVGVARRRHRFGVKRHRTNDKTICVVSGNLEAQQASSISF